MHELFLQQLKEITGDSFVFDAEDIKAGYARDHSLHQACPFDVLVKPATARQIAAIFCLCNQYKVPVTPRGGGTGVTGGALPVAGGVVLSLERLNRIIEIDVPNRYAILETGVVTQVFCEALEAAGMYFPVAPGSKGSSFIGGNIAENAAGARSCKYGTFKDQVLNLEVVLPTGEIIYTGANVYKNATGFNLTHLFTGSEGMLGIITRAVLKIIPRPSKTSVLLIGFKELEQACQAVLQLAGNTIKPSCIEMITREAIDITLPFLPAGYPMLGKETNALLLLEWEEYAEPVMVQAIDNACAILEGFDVVDIYSADTTPEIAFIWRLREIIGEAMTHNGHVYRDIDACVPPARLYDYLKAVNQAAKKYDRTVISFGHAMDGNLHTMLLLTADQAYDAANTKDFLTAIFTAAVEMGGVISGEHGIGCLQQDFLPLQMSTKQLSILQQIKNVFDPNGILNPGKLLSQGLNN